MNKKVERFEDLRVWQEAIKLSKAIYEATRKKFFSDDPALIDQIRRAAISISSNIAEGFERDSQKEFIMFLLIAKGSSGEVRSQLHAAADLGYLTRKEFGRLQEQSQRISRMLANLVQYLKGT